MKSKFDIIKAMLTGITIFCLITSTAYSAILFEDNFNDGMWNDTWLVDWTNTNVDPNQQTSVFPEIRCITDNCFIDGKTYNDGDYLCSAILYTENPTNIGSWQFQSRLSQAEDDQYNFLSIGTGNSAYDNNYRVCHTESGGIILIKMINKVNTYLISAPQYSGKDDIWHTIKVTRSPEGEWTLYVDDTIIGSVLDNTITEFPYLFIGRYGNYDNVIVTDNYIEPVTFLCSGFESPLANGPVKVKKNRVIPVKAELIDDDGVSMTDTEIISAPIIQVTYTSSPDDEAVDVSEAAYAVGIGSDGNDFEYNPTDEVWQFNLKTNNYTAPGTYTITIKSGDEAEYIVDTCEAQFVVE